MTKKAQGTKHIYGLRNMGKGESALRILVGMWSYINDSIVFHQAAFASLNVSRLFKRN